MSEDRECTCHPDEAPVPCRKKYAFTECENEQLREENARLREERDNFYIEYRMICDKECKIVHAENEKLRAALKPFAELSQHTGSMSDSDGVCVYVEDLHAAAAAMREGGNRDE